MGKKSRRKQARQQISPIKKDKPNPNLLPVQSNILKSKLRGSFLFAGALILGIGVPEMIAGHEYAPWLIATGSFLASLVIVTDDDIRRMVAHLIRSKWFRITVYLSVCLLLTFGSFILSYGYSDNQRELLARTPIFYGELTPGNEPTPSFPSFPLGYGIPPYTFIVMLGDDNGFFIDGSVDNAFYLKRNPFLTIRTKDDGTVVFNTEVLDSTNHRIIKVVDNEFQANPEYAFRPRQPDKHSLIVRDSEGVEVLNIRYINPKVIRITGRFFSPQDSQIITISPSGVIDLGEFELRGIYTTLTTGEKIFLGEPPEEFINEQ